MEKRSRLIFIHIIQSLIVSVVAGAIVAVLRVFLHKNFNSLVDSFVTLGPYRMGILIVFIFTCIGIIFPNTLIPLVRSLKYLPVHFGLIAKVTIAATIYIVIDFIWINSITKDYISSASFLLCYCSCGLILGYILACLIEKLRRQHEKILSQEPKKRGLDAWLLDDQPIKNIDNSLFPAHSEVAQRILKKFLIKVYNEPQAFSSIALIGPYGSGKTSICYMSEDFYRRERKKQYLPNMIFCRFEAWQFLSPEAAVGHLITVAKNRILELADFPELWRIPEKYIEAIKAGGSLWSSFLALLFGRGTSPQEIALCIGDILVRVNIRLVIFVDDFDRIESDSFATQQAVAKALNQIQNVPNIQYVISIGPTLGAKKTSKEDVRSWDLTKLTRFQELVPQIDPGVVISHIRKLRDQVLQDNLYYFPWSEIKNGESDPLTYYHQFRSLLSFGFRGAVLGLVRTPRALKCVLRESKQSWEEGLKGEIDWYDLILTNAIKASEPAVFEWIARDRDVFIEEPPQNITEPQSHANKQYSEEISKRLSECIESRDPAHYEAVKEALCHLFPAFEAKLNAGNWISKHIPQWSQKISCRPNQGRNYLERFFAGGVSEDDIPDQPTLQYIRKITQEGFDGSDFESIYLSSVEKLTGVLNKIVQFAGLIPQETAFKICDTILAWIDKPEHSQVWPEPERYIFDMLPDIFNIIKESGMRKRQS